MSTLVNHAKFELELAGMIQHGESDDPADNWNNMTANAVLDIVKLFSDQGHSGMSAEMTVQLLERLLRYKPLTDLKYTDEEWFKHDDTTWQNKRRSSTFSDDQGKTWYDIDGPYDDDGKPVRHPIEAAS